MSGYKKRRARSQSYRAHSRRAHNTPCPPELVEQARATGGRVYCLINLTIGRYGLVPYKEWMVVHDEVLTLEDGRIAISAARYQNITSITLPAFFEEGSKIMISGVRAKPTDT